ncbi:MAG TPA: lycopene cyclase domain-containing protein [Candidatus Omnitrophota bacterium]|nr:lycopene cyclase domain-containing protein [Candidatus Omnitrophota bacterium]HPD84868.1 lycopene cyclase domain-containing protein [Candidatus Omnitrophota bacterium]HRZ03726.1 lycopene cyclase domain-containing protein [Candidatus Omnitrophota bacterium]
MSTYLWIDFLVIIFPFLFSFKKKIGYYRRFPELFLSILSVGTVFIVWDVMATARGDWGFNARYVLGMNFFGLPLEEVLFFVVVPFSCIFIYEVIALYIKEGGFRIPRAVFLVWAMGFLALAFFNQERAYTFTVLMFCGAAMLLTLWFLPGLLNSSRYWLFILAGYVPFLIVNYILTALPVVVYNPAAVWGVRVLTIPLEDFFYSYAMLSLNLTVYLYYRKFFRGV